MLQLEPGLMIWTWITFLVLFFILAKVAWKPLVSAVQQREQTISDSLNKAEMAKNEAQRLLEEQEKKLASAHEEIQQMLKENKELAEKMKTEIIEKARAEADKLHQRAQADIARERDAAIIELRKQVADLTILAASRLIKENLDDTKNRNLIDQYIKELDQLDKN
ncbi:MAG: F0F1 ATP synthase subunit B [Calditrichia bacterium]